MQLSPESSLTFSRGGLMVPLEVLPKLRVPEQRERAIEYLHIPLRGDG